MPTMMCWGNGPSGQCSLRGLSEDHIPHTNQGAPHSYALTICPNQGTVCAELRHLLPGHIPTYCLVIFSLKFDISASIQVYHHWNWPTHKALGRDVESPQKLKATRFLRLARSQRGLLCKRALVWMAPSLNCLLFKSDLAQKAYGYLTDKEQSEFKDFSHWERGSGRLSPHPPPCPRLAALPTCPPEVSQSSSHTAPPSSLLLLPHKHVWRWNP